MSTEYRLRGQGVRWSEKRWRALAKIHDFTIEVKDKHLMATDGTNYVHIYPNASRTAWNYFERWGANNSQFLLDALDADDQPWLSELDEGYYK